MSAGIQPVKPTIESEAYNRGFERGRKKTIDEVLRMIDERVKDFKEAASGCDGERASVWNEKILTLNSLKQAIAEKGAKE